MSCLSELIITVRPSLNYRRLAWVLTGCAMVSLYVSSVPLLLAVILNLGMGWALWQMMRCPMPHPGLRTICFQKKKWVLDFGDNCCTYEHIHICLDTGLFLLCHFSCTQSPARRFLVVFYDQLSHDELRGLNIIHTISSIKKKSR